MKRVHALEWEDLTWFPNSWRDYGTDYLRFIATKFNIYKDVAPLMKEALDKSGRQEIVDVASGGGSGLIKLAETLKLEKENLVITLTDYFPNLKAFERTQKEVPGVFQFEKDSVNAMEMPKHLHGQFRTIFGAFHHFRPADARKILQNVVDTNSSVGVFEPVGRNAPSVFSMLFVILNVLLLTPFIRPVRWQVLPFIYLLPIIPLYILWDGVASILRTYSKQELEQLVKSVRNSDTYVWKIDKTKGPMPVNYLIGYKK